jgi:hypothetical protein
VVTSRLDMLNLVRFLEKAAYPPEQPCAGSTMTGADAYRIHLQRSGPIFARVGEIILWSAMPRLVLIGLSDE